MAMGEVLNQKGVKSLYIMAPNYAAGKNMVAGVKRTFKGKVLGTDFTKWGKDAQLDFSAELAKAKASGAEGIFVFYPGKAGGAFIKQYQQAGLQGKIPLYTTFTVDAIALPKLQAAKLEGVLGSENTQQWSPDLDNAANKKFVGDFKKKHGRYPSFYAAQAYDSIMLIKSAVEAVKRRYVEHGRYARCHEEGRLRLGARQVHLWQQPHADPELLSAQGGEGRGRQLDDEDHQDGLPRTTRTSTPKTAR